MTIRKFMKLYSHYKTNFDLEIGIQRKGISYAQLAELQIQEEEWL